MKRQNLERTLGWLRWQLREWSNEMPNQGRGSSGKCSWPMETPYGGPTRKPRNNLGLLTVLEDPGDPRENVREARPRDTNGAKSRTESNSLRLFNSYFYSGHDLLLVGFALLGNIWEQLQDRSASGKRGNRGVPEECLANWE